jgi:hypothetical protein
MKTLTSTVKIGRCYALLFRYSMVTTKGAISYFKITPFIPTTVNNFTENSFGISDSSIPAIT